MSVTDLDRAASNHQAISAKKVAPPDVLPTPLVPPPLRSSPKIRDRHRDRLAVVYVRQSSPHQVLENRESRERQYGLAMLAQQFGWPADRVLVNVAATICSVPTNGESAIWRPGCKSLRAGFTIGFPGIGSTPVAPFPAKPGSPGRTTTN